MKRFHLILLLGTMLSLFSCTHKELCMEHPHMAPLRLEFDWRDAPSADPDGMCVFFYPLEGGEPRRFDFSDLSGGRISLAVGSYKVICYNNDTERVYFGYTSDFAMHSVFTPNTDLFAPLGLTSKAGVVPRADASERVVSTPDMLWGCSVELVEVPEVLEGEAEERVITLYPHRLVRNYTLRVLNCEGLKYAEQMCGSIYGMSGGLFFASELNFEENVTLPFECYKADETTIEAKFLTFGDNPNVCNPHSVLLYIWMTDGKIRCYGLDDAKFDVSAQVHGAADPYDVLLVIDGLDLPKPISNGSGFAPEVDDWVEINEDINM